jgi:hypothetical protein
MDATSRLKIRTPGANTSDAVCPLYVKARIRRRNLNTEHSPELLGIPERRLHVAVPRKSTVGGDCGVLAEAETHAFHVRATE